MGILTILHLLQLVITLPQIVGDGVDEFEAILSALKSGKELNFTQVDQFPELSRVDAELPGVDPEANMNFVSVSVKFYRRRWCYFRSTAE